MTNVEVWLWILLVMLPHNGRTTKLLAGYGSALEAAIAMRDGKCDMLTAAEKQRVERTRTREVKALIAECERLGIRIVTLDDPEYPPKLKCIEDPPIVLFVKGDLKPLKDMSAVAVVGPRAPSEYSRRITGVLCGELSKDRVGVVSGLAVGIDGEAHRCTVNSGGYTVGVLACGHMVNYPAENTYLKNSIIENGGAVISELFPYTSAKVFYFRQRNRIIAGLSEAAVVIEASAKSGTLVTAELIREQSKPIFCVPPHDITDERYYGSVSLLRSGALPLYAATDIYTELTQRGEDGVHIVCSSSQEKPLQQKAQKKAKQDGAKKKRSAPAEKTNAQPMEFVETAPADEIDMTQFSPEEALVITLLQEKPFTMDEIIEKSGMRHDQVCSIVLGLELMDVITRCQNGTFVLI